MNLSDEDVKAISKQIRKDFIDNFKLDVGAGILGIAWRGVIIIILFIAYYGATRGHG